MTLPLLPSVNPTLVGSRSQVKSEDSGAQVGRKFQERKRSAGLDDNSLETVVQHVRRDKLELLGRDEDVRSCLGSGGSRTSSPPPSQPETRVYHQNWSLFNSAHA
jgi:hypothetical protein